MYKLGGGKSDKGKWTTAQLSIEFNFYNKQI